MPQGALPFQYAQEKGSTVMTALAGLGAYLDLWQVAGLPQSLRRHLGVKGGAGLDRRADGDLPGVLLNLAGGECVEAPRSSRGQALHLLEKDEGLGRGVEAGRDPGDGPAGAPGASGEVAEGTPGAVCRHPRRCSGS